MLKHHLKNTENDDDDDFYELANWSNSISKETHKIQINGHFLIISLNLNQKLICQFCTLISFDCQWNLQKNSNEEKFKFYQVKKMTFIV